MNIRTFLEEHMIRYNVDFGTWKASKKKILDLDFLSFVVIFIVASYFFIIFFLLNAVIFNLNYWISSVIPTSLDVLLGNGAIPDLQGNQLKGPDAFKFWLILNGTFIYSLIFFLAILIIVLHYNFSSKTHSETKKLESYKEKLDFYNEIYKSPSILIILVALSLWLIKFFYEFTFNTHFSQTFKFFSKLR